MLRSLQADQLLLQQVISFTGLMFIVFVESALGQIPTFYGAAPKLVFGLLFVIGIRFPKAVPLLPVMVLGLIYDLVQGNPFGYSSSLYLIILIFTQLRGVVLVEADATTLWSEFVLLVFGLMLYMMIVFGFYTGTWPPVSEMIFQTGFTILLFPIMNWGFDFYKNVSILIGGGK